MKIRIMTLAALTFFCVNVTHAHAQDGVFFEQNFPNRVFIDKLTQRSLSGLINTLPYGFSQDLVSPEYVVENADEIGINETKRQRIINMIADSQAAITKIKLNNSGRNKRIDEILSKTPIDKETALNELDLLINHESYIKREQLSLMIDVRNELTKAEFDKYQAIRAERFTVKLQLNPDNEGDLAKKLQEHLNKQ